MGAWGGHLHVSHDLYGEKDLNPLAWEMNSYKYYLW